MSKKAVSLIEKYVEEIKNQVDLPFSDVHAFKTHNDNHSLGRCQRVSFFNGEHTKYIISLNKKMLNCSEQDIKNTLLHELIHTIDGCFNHGDRFKYYAEKVNQKYGYHIARANSVKGFKEQIKYRYIVKCTKCGISKKYLKKSDVVKYPSLYRCPCGGHLESIEL